MKVSLHTVKQYTDVNLGIDELVQKINSQLGVVEEVINLGERYEEAIIVKIISAQPHPNADRLQVCLIDDGGVVQDVPRDENGYVQVVCGAPNARAGIFVVWLPPGSTVPASYSEKELFVLGSRELRGVLSHGMLAASDELAIGSDHDGILEIDPSEWKPSEVAIAPGASFAQAYGLDDYIIDIENKMFTHRPDLFGQLGVAREIAGILGQKFTSPATYLDAPIFQEAAGLELEVLNETPSKVPRLMAVAFKNVDVQPSPLWLQCALVSMGAKPINTIVDITNYTMLLTAQPTHAYDYDKLRGHKLIARQARDGEKIKLLNHKEYTLTVDDVVIADSEGPIGLGGIMGGGDSEVDSRTKNIVLEVASFDMYTVRKSSMRHGVFTDALTRFNKGQSPLQNDHIMSNLIDSLKAISNIEPASQVFDVRGEYDSRTTPDGIYRADGQAITTAFINDRLGLKLTGVEIKQLLENVEFNVQIDEHGMDVYAPFWRTDIEYPEDIVEEVGRLYGFDHLPLDLPKRPMTPVAKNSRRELKQAIRRSLTSAGMNEVLTYSFVHEEVLKKVGQSPEWAFRLGNALSPDLQYYRLSVTPSLLDKVHTNKRAGFDSFGIFEFGRGHNKRDHANDDEHDLPREQNYLAAVYVAPASQTGSAFYGAKRYLERVTSAVGVSLEFVPLTDSPHVAATPFEIRRSAQVKVAKTGKILGMVGEYKASVVKNFKLPLQVAGFEIDIDTLERSLSPDTNYQPLSRYPSVERDVCFQVNQTVSYGQIIDSLVQASGKSDLVTTISPLDIYQPDQRDTKNITVRVTLTSHQKTLTGSEASVAIDQLISSVVAATGAVVI